MVELAIPSHGSPLLGVFYLAAGSAPHPTVVLMHGFPGYEQNLDLARAMRRAGWNVLAMHYRGSWGVPGGFSFSHAIEDADAEVAFVEDPASLAKYRIDPRRIVLLGHSMGGYMVASASAHNHSVAGTVMLSGWNIGDKMKPLTAEQEALALASFKKQTQPEDLLPLAGCTAETLARDIFEHRSDWTFERLAPSLRAVPMLVVTSNDGLETDGNAMLNALSKSGNERVKSVHLATDHAYSDQRLALISIVLSWLATV